jgi:hypothetical protein
MVYMKYVFKVAETWGVQNEFNSNDLVQYLDFFRLILDKRRLGRIIDASLMHK